MGANVYLESVASYGFQSGTSAQITQEIPGRTGKRIAIRAFGFSAGGTISNIYFMQSLGKTTLAADMAATLTIMNLTSEPGPTGNSLAAGDNICIVKDDGEYDFSIVGTVTGLSNIVLCTLASGSCASGAIVYDLGIYSDTGHIVYGLATVSVVNTEELDGGIFYGAEKGSPMRVVHLCACTGTETINYITVDYINK